MSGVEVPSLGSYKDRVLRKFMDQEARRRLKSEQLTYAIALSNCTNEEGRKLLSGIWKELVQLEFGIETEVKEQTESLTDRWLKEYELMKSSEVKLVRKQGSLIVEGLN